jgi:signal transduction histidine kinase
VSGAAILVTTLAIVGVTTALALHTHKVGALDDALLAAALGRAHPDVAGEVEVEHVESPIEAWLVRPGDPRVPSDVARQALRNERPVFFETGAARLVVLPFEVEGPIESTGLAAAAAPRLTLTRSVGPFALIYSLLSALAAAVAMVSQGRMVRRAFRPVDRARDEAERVLGLGAGQRLTIAGPVEIRSLLAAINALLARLEDAHHAQARFTAEAAHELRTPVAAMLGELDVALRDAGLAEPTRAILGSLREEVVRLRRLVEGLTALARIDAGQIDQGRELLRAAELASLALAAEEPTLRSAGCSVRIRIDDDPELEGHRSLLEVALGNLLRNAARHAPGTPVELRVGRLGHHAVFDVDDAGPGIPADAREALFDRFARAPGARLRDRAGLGLGLPIAREVGRRHGGDCTLLASPTGGLRARLTIRACVESDSRG